MSLSGKLVGAEFVVKAPVGVEQVALTVGIQKRPAFELAVNIDQSFSEPLQCRDRDRQAVDLSRHGVRATSRAG